MNLDGARIYNDGVRLSPNAEAKIHQIVTAIKSLSPKSEVSMRFLKNGHLYEGLLWCKANEVPIGVYNRGPSMTHVLDTLYKRVKRQCMKVLRKGGYTNPSLALAG